MTRPDALVFARTDQAFHQRTAAPVFAVDGADLSETRTFHNIELLFDNQDIAD